MTARMRRKDVDIAAGDMNFRPQHYEESIIWGDIQLPNKPEMHSQTIGARSNREKTIFDCWPLQLQTCVPREAADWREPVAKHMEENHDMLTDKVNEWSKILKGGRHRPPRQRR